jgi:outer membrane protein assembly factor BamB
MTVIELGDVTSGSDVPPSADAPPEFTARAARRFLLVLVAILAVLTVTGSARPEPSMLRNRWSIPFGADDQFSVTTDSVYVATGGRLSAYDLTSGVLRWSRPSAEPTGWLNPVGSAGVVLMPADRVTQQFNSDDGGSYLTEFYRETVAVDIRTGAQLWRRAGQVYGTARESALLVDHEVGRTDRLRAFRLVRLRDGSVLWTSPAGGAVQMATGGSDPANPSFLVTVTATGQAAVFRIADGTRVAAGHVDFRTTAPDKGAIVDMFADGHNVYVRSADARGDELTAYELGTLRRVWRVSSARRVTAYACVPVVCSIQPDSVEAFDPRTGRTLWRVPSMQNAWPISPGWLVVNDGSLDTWALIEAATGRRVPGLVRGTPVQSADGTDTYLMQRTREPVRRTAVNRIDLPTGRVALRGAIEWISDYGCAAAAHRIVCPSVNGRLSVAEVG